jgi:hypothetical protein
MHVRLRQGMTVLVGEGDQDAVHGWLELIRSLAWSSSTSERCAVPSYHPKAVMYTAPMVPKLPIVGQDAPRTHVSADRPLPISAQTTEFEKAKTRLLAG